METRDILFSIVMVISAFTLTFRWLSIYHESDPVMILSAIILIGALASLLISIELRLKRIETIMEEQARSFRFNIRGIEEGIERKLESYTRMLNETVNELSRRMYR